MPTTRHFTGYLWLIALLMMPTTALADPGIALRPGVHVYVAGGGNPPSKSPYQTVQVCASARDYDRDDKADSHCEYHNAGVEGVVLKTQVGDTFGPKPVLLKTSRWEGVVEQSDLVPILRKGAVISCDGATSDRYFEDANGEEGKDLRDEPISLRVTETEAPSTAGLVMAVVIRGELVGARGYFPIGNSVSDIDVCTVDGLKLYLDDQQ